MPDTSAPCPFVAGPMITDSRLFFGRKDELRTLVGKMSGAQPVSVNVVGERRIGKSSLLCHFSQTWEQRVPDPARFVLVYLDLQAKTPTNEAVFYQTLARELAKRPAVRRVEALRQLLLAPPRTHQGFAELLEQFADHLLLPVFCLDEFEILLKCGDQFTDSFFDRLRGCMNASQLMFILSSRRPLNVYAGEQNLTSAFFNLGHVLNLGDLTEEAADELVLLPLPDTDRPALNPEDQLLARQWGGGHPYLLQLAATALFEARQAGKSTAWAKEQFEEQRCRMPKPKRWYFQRLWTMLRRMVWDFPCWLGGKPFRIGRILSDIGNWITGTIFILLFMGLLLNLKEAGVVYTLFLKALNYFKQIV